MKRVNLAEENYLTISQKKLDDLYFAISTQRYCHVIDGTIVPALTDNECEQLAKKIEEALTLAKELYDKSQKRSRWDHETGENVIIIDLEVV